jgi:hypothetical protein
VGDPAGRSRLAEDGRRATISRSEVARPAGFEPATFGSGGEIPIPQPSRIQRLTAGAMPGCHANLLRCGSEPPFSTGEVSGMLTSVTEVR